MEKHIKRTFFILVMAGIYSPLFGEKWTASVLQNLEALVGSCVVLPCSFSHPGPSLSASRLRGIWHRENNMNEIYFHKDITKVLDSFKGRTKLLGNLDRDNCTLEISDVKGHDNGPFCFRIEVAETDENKETRKKFSFNKDCVMLKMLKDPPEPQPFQLNTAVQGKPYVVICSVRHTCPSHVPVFTWSRGSENDIIQIQREIHSGIWETESVLTFIPDETDDHTEITCTATFNGGRTSFKNIKLIVKLAVAIGTALIIGVFCIFIVKKYKNHIAELQNQQGSMFNRLSRMSRRFHSGGQ